MSVQLRLGENHCNNCIHYSPGGFGGYICSNEGCTYVPGDRQGCNLHNTIVLSYSKACKDFELKGENQ